MIDDAISKEQVEKSIDDWVTRITNLYTSIQEWLSPLPAYELKKRNDVRMYEELMQKNHIPARTLTSLDIYFHGKMIATIQPMGLWLVGANGRVDILLSRGAVTLIDAAKRFEPPNWVAHERPRNGKGDQFTKDFLYKILGVH